MIQRHWSLINDGLISLRYNRFCASQINTHGHPEITSSIPGESRGQIGCAFWGRGGIYLSTPMWYFSPSLVGDVSLFPVRFYLYKEKKKSPPVTWSILCITKH